MVTTCLCILPTQWRLNPDGSLADGGKDCRPLDAEALLDRWHRLGHRPVRLSGNRQITQLAFWLALCSPRTPEADLEAVRRQLGTRVSG